jgi:hypothetical protein
MGSNGSTSSGTARKLRRASLMRRATFLFFAVGPLVLHENAEFFLKRDLFIGGFEQLTGSLRQRVQFHLDQFLDGFLDARVVSVEVSAAAHVSFTGGRDLFGEGSLGTRSSPRLRIASMCRRQPQGRRPELVRRPLHHHSREKRRRRAARGTHRVRGDQVALSPAFRSANCALRVDIVHREIDAQALQHPKAIGRSGRTIPSLRDYVVVSHRVVASRHVRERVDSRA